MYSSLELSKKILVLVGIVIFNSLCSYGQSVNNINDKFVIILDVQREYTENSISEVEAQQLIDSINYVIKHTDVNNILYVKSAHRLLNISSSKPFIYVSFDTAAKWNLDSRMILVNENVISKEESNIFDEVELTDILVQNNVKEIIVIGLMAEKCVYESLIGGVELGYEMYVIPEAIVGKSTKSEEKIIKKLQASGVNILHLDAMIK